MSDLERFNELVDEIYEMIMGTERRPKPKPKPKKRKRARKKDGTFRGDDKSTPNVNEAWEN